MSSPHRMPSGAHFHPTISQSTSSTRKKPRQPRLPFISSRSDSQAEYEGNLSNDTAQAQRNVSDDNSRWWKVRLFRGMINDVRRRAPFYWSDWTDAWDYRVIPATVYMYFVRSLIKTNGQDRDTDYHQQAKYEPRIFVRYQVLFCKHFSA